MKKKAPKSIVQKHFENSNVSKKKTQQIISKYHTILKNLEQLNKKSDRTEEEEAQIHDLQKQMQDIGGLPAYQLASLKGGDVGKGFSGCGKWLLKTLRDLKIENSFKSAPTARLRMLDVGAISGEVYENEKVLDVVSIDLNSQSSLVLKQDFFERPIPQIDQDKFNIIGLSLVLNFVPDPARRGEMLKRTRAHLRPHLGLLFVVLPLPCISNSRYLTHEVFEEMMLSLGFHSLRYHHSKKLAYYLFQLKKPSALTDEPSVKYPKKELVKGSKRNNFSIILL